MAAKFRARREAPSRGASPHTSQWRVFKKAIREDRVVLTFDLDFGEIVALSKGKRTGVILFRLQNTRAEYVIKRLAALFADLPPSFANRVVIVEDARYRIRQFPD